MKSSEIGMFLVGVALGIVIGVGIAGSAVIAGLIR